MSFLFLAGCASLSPKEQAARDKVLYQYREVAVAMRQAEFARAKTVLDDILLFLGGISAGDKTAREARSNFREESRKNFRGEPYEQIMAYYYRAILYWMDGQPDNARACLRTAALLDADVEKKEYQSDYVLLDYLDGLASTKLKGDGSDAFQRATKVAHLAQPPPYDPTANVLVFVEMGRGPTKYAAGKYREELHFKQGSSEASSAVVTVDSGGSSTVAPAYDDLTFQATSRDGRVMDHILAGKAVFKKSTDTAGNVLLAAGAGSLLLGQGQTSREVGAGLMMLGLIGKGIAAATTPAADLRTWDNLPNLLGFSALRASTGSHKMTIEFRNPTGQPTLSRHFAFEVVEGQDTVIFVSDRD